MIIAKVKVMSLAFSQHFSIMAPLRQQTKFLVSIFTILNSQKLPFKENNIFEK